MENNVNANAQEMAPEVENDKQEATPVAETAPVAEAVPVKVKKAKKGKFNYFDCFVRMAEFANREAQLFLEVVENFDPEKLDDYRAAIHENEHACDMEKHAMAEALVRDFLPPIDRDDLFHLAHVVDNLTDSLDNIMSLFYMLNIRSLRADTKQFAALMAQSCGMVCELLGEFHNFKKSTRLRELVVALNDLEEQGDRLHADAMRALSCEEGIDTRELVEWREIYTYFEECIDMAESVADNVESIVMKNA